MSIINKECAEHYKWGADSDGWHLLKSESLSVIQERVPPGDTERHHYHRKAQQFFYVLSGAASVEISGVMHLVQAGSGIHVAALDPHRLTNAGSTDLSFLVISEPMSHGDRVDS